MSQRDNQQASGGIRIVELGPMRVASFHGFGAEPETKAHQKLYAWMEAHDLMENFEEQRIFGFNNPNPSAGSPNYGYELWLAVGPEVETEGEMEVKDFAGGLYAVLSCTPRSGEEIGEAWQRLVAWQTTSSYQHARHQWLEEHIWEVEPRTEGDPFEGKKLTLNLYLPILR